MRRYRGATLPSKRSAARLGLVNQETQEAKRPTKSSMRHGCFKSSPRLLWSINQAIPVPRHRPRTTQLQGGQHDSVPRGQNLLLSLEVVKENRALLRLLTPVLNNDARAVHDLASVALTVKGAYKHETSVHRLLHQPPQGKGERNTIKEYIHRPTHSPSIFPSGTLIRGILCSEHRATTSFL